jgi:hypothetical protein
MVTRVRTILGFAAVILALPALELLGRRENSRIPTLGEWLGYVMRPAGRPPAGPARLAVDRLALLLPVAAGTGRSARLAA